MQLEHQGLDEAEPSVLLACFREAGHMPVAPVAGAPGADLAAAEPLLRRRVPEP